MHIICTYNVSAVITYRYTKGDISRRILLIGFVPALRMHGIEAQENDAARGRTNSEDAFFLRNEYVHIAKLPTTVSYFN